MKNGATYLGKINGKHVVIDKEGDHSKYTDDEMEEVHGVSADDLSKLKQKEDGEDVKGVGKHKGSSGKLIHSKGDDHFVRHADGNISKYNTNEMKEVFGYGEAQSGDSAKKREGDNNGVRDKKKIPNGISGLPYLIHRGNPTIKEGKEMIGEYHDIDNSKTSFDGGGNPTYFDKKGRKIGTHDKTKGKIHVYHH